MAKRLVKVAKELNVGTSTIVDHLRSKGFEIENKPIAKITDAMEAELRKEFAKAIAIKEQADSLIIGTRPVTKKEDLPEEKTTPTNVAPPPPAPPKEVVKSTPPPPPPAPVEAKKPEPVVEKIEKVEPVKATPKEEEKVQGLRGLKIKGKINLDKKPAPKKENTEKVEPPAPKVAAEKPKEEIAQEKPKEIVKEEQPAAAPSPQVEAKKPVPSKEVREETPPAPQVKVEHKQEEKAPPPKAVEEKAPEQKPAPAKPVVNKVPPKQKEEAKPLAEQKKPEGGAAANDDENKPLETIRAATPELRGLKILGKINIEKKPKKKRENSGNNRRREDGNRPRRPEEGDARKRPDGAAKTDKGATTSSDNQGERKRRRRKTVRASSLGGNTGGTGSGGNRQGANTGNRGRTAPGRRGDNRRGPVRGRGRQDDVKEVSKKEIEDNIKATMARLSGRGGGKKKRQKLARGRRERLREKQEQIEASQENEKLQVTEFVTVQEIANLMDVAVTDVIMACMGIGVIVSINQRLDAEIIELVASEFNHEVEFISAEEEADEEEEIIDAPEDLEPRAPIVTVMGHVDHGKTSLLDYIREAKVADGEAGGITQHIGAYEVQVGEENKRITFLDTPGHEAFTAMRARGAKVTDVAIIIIAADDNIMPQTKEAISHSQAAGVPMVFAINKIDKPGAKPERIKQELASMNLLIEEWGGEYQSQDISAKTGEGIDELLEKVLLVAELLELKANPNRQAIGAVLEASLDKGRGYVAKTLVQTGSLSIGDPIVAGEYSGKVKAMFNERGKRIKIAGPSTPVLVLGLGGAPTAGERFKEMDSESEARQLAQRRAQIAREQSNRATKRISLDEIGRRLALGSFKELNLIIKGDFDGSVEALSDSLIKQSIESVQVNVIHKAVGQIIESDVLLASASDAIIIGFQVRPSVSARRLAEQEGVQIKTYSIIYEAIEELKMAIEGMLEPTKEEKILGNVEVREVFKISKVGTIAGCYVTDGKVLRNANVRVIRNGIVIYPTKEGATGELASLKRFKDDVKEVKNGMECGLNVKNFNDIKVGDEIEVFEIIEVKQTLKSLK